MSRPPPSPPYHRTVPNHSQSPPPIDLPRTSAVHPRPRPRPRKVDFLTTIPTAADPARRALRTQPHLRAFQDAIAAPARCPQPVIAALHGNAIGLAIDMVTACDVRYAADDVKFSIKARTPFPSYPPRAT